MNSTSWPLGAQAAPRPAPGELIEDYRSRLALEQFQAEERRQRDFAEQSSTLNAPDARIRAWEKMHGLRLPRDPAHPVLSVVVAVTGLTLEQVHEEQRRRVAAAQPATPVSVPPTPSP
jgi:hypothetical protein